MPVNSGAKPLPPGGHSTQWPPLWVPEEREDVALPVVAARPPRPPPAAPVPLVDPPTPLPLEVALPAPPVALVVPVVVVAVVPAAVVPVAVVPVVVEVPVVDAEEFCTVGSDTTPPPAG